MALSTGSRGVLVDIVGWAAAFSIGGLVYANFGALKAMIAEVPAQVTSGPKAQAAKADDDGARSSTVRKVELKVDRNGHFFSELEINGRRIEAMVDTGASMIALTYEDARSIGVTPRDSDFTQRVSTANGVARVAPVNLARVQIGDIMVRNVDAVVVEERKLNTTLLGNTFLSRLSRYEMRNGRMVLEE